ncbi:MAG: DUF4382 domain-containing protein [Candidatus Micrarchaeota archaeon]
MQENLNKKTGGLFLVLALVLVVVMAGCLGPNSGTTAPPANSGSGRAVFSMTDATADMGSISEIKWTVDSVSVHSQTQGWITVSTSSKTVSLLELKNSGQSAVLADVQLKHGNYDQVRLMVSNVQVTDGAGTHGTKLPSGEIKIVNNFEAKSGEIASASFDVLASESLHVTGNGEYVMAPVINMESRNGVDIQSQGSDRIKISGGTVFTSTKVGMTADGVVDVGLSIPNNAAISIGNDGKVHVDSMIDVGG